MGFVAEYDFETLDPIQPAMSPVDQAAAVMDVLAEARAEADQIRRQALEEGYAAGRHEALEALAPALAALGAATEEVRAAQADTASELELRAVELGMALASKVLAGALSVEPERVLDSVQGALRGIVERERVIVMVNPEDLEIVQGAAEELKATLGGIDHCVIEAERRVGRGGCIVRTPVGDVDARIETKLERASEVVAAALGKSSPGKPAAKSAAKSA
ncbi:FliH/SctL family protein [Solirubrobacter phytolaccae]|uniref:FliH/SctL family protein n=1 Tax=Solirubrobacter phytolaccae TaxID=1404360 RepID=A0A9X3NCD5_9ACTN|nr:FliH/SctL family protein [Solirubrobacter phytolaccae]MDA0183863.1 FliH/SctL family protein [Solirubrobacter phytolaccae]